MAAKWHQYCSTGSKDIQDGWLVSRLTSYKMHRSSQTSINVPLDWLQVGTKQTYHQQLWF